MNYEKNLDAPWTVTSNRPGWMHFGLKTYEIPRNSPDNGQSGGFSKFYVFVDLRQVKAEIADPVHFYYGRFDFCWVRGCLDAKTWTLTLYQN